MTTELKVLGTGDVENVINEIEQAFFDIPFGNTEFQSRVFVLDSAITPERRYRIIGLQLLSTLNSVRNAIYQQNLFKIGREEDLDKLNNGNLSEWDRKRLELKMQKEDWDNKFSDKVLNDSIRDLNLFYSEFKKLPKFTREQFEMAEFNYFSQNLERQARGITGPVEALINMNEDMPANLEYLEKVKQLENLDNKTLETLRLAMPNQLDNVAKKQEKESLERARLDKLLRQQQE